MKRILLFILLWQSYVVAAAEESIVSTLKRTLEESFEQKDAETAITAFARLSTLCRLDMKYHNRDDTDRLENFAQNYVNKLMQLNLSNDQLVDHLQVRSKETMLWLSQKIETEKCSVDWSVFGIGKATLSEEEMESYRTKEFNDAFRHINSLASSKEKSD